MGREGLGFVWQHGDPWGMVSLHVKAKFVIFTTVLSARVGWIEGRFRTARLREKGPGEKYLGSW